MAPGRTCTSRGKSATSATPAEVNFAIVVQGRTARDDNSVTFRFGMRIEA